MTKEVEKQYNVYDREDNIIFVGMVKEVAEFLHIDRNRVRKYVRECRDYKGYLIADRNMMLDYERRRKNKVGYQRYQRVKKEKKHAEQ